MHPIKALLLVSVGALASVSALQAQKIETPAPSPAAELNQTVGVTEFTVTYSRPSVKERPIFGELVPFDEVWRTGANAPTKIKFDSEITFGGKTVPAGEYVLFTIPGKDEWTVILYGDTKVGGAGSYDEKNDVARVTAKPLPLSTPVESFTIGFDNLRDESATLFLDWDTVRVPVAIEIDTASFTQASLDEAMKDMDSWTARDYASAATFYADNGKDKAKATEWMGKAASMDDKAFWWQHSYALMLAEQGQKEAAIAAAEKSLATAKASAGGDSGYIKRNEELLATLNK